MLSRAFVLTDPESLSSLLLRLRWPEKSSTSRSDIGDRVGNMRGRAAMNDEDEDVEASGDADIGEVGGSVMVV